jgi:hypothetical protein
MQAANKVSFTAIRRKCIETQRTKLFSLLRDAAATANNPQIKSTINNISLKVLEEIGPSAVIPLEFPSRQYLIETFIRRIVDLLPFFERSMQLVGGKVLRADKLYKAVKFVFTATSVDGKSRGQGSTKAYDSVYTMMNEHNQIVSLHFVRSGDMKEVQVILERVQRRYKLRGFEQIDLFYTDNCCQEYKMLTRAFPSLAKNEAQTSNP